MRESEKEAETKTRRHRCERATLDRNTKINEINERQRKLNGARGLLLSWRARAKRANKTGPHFEAPLRRQKLHNKPSRRLPVRARASRLFSTQVASQGLRESR